jgi:PAS domain S-box-containing protein
VETRKTKKELLEFTESIVNAVREPLIVLDADLRVVAVSRSFYDFFRVDPKDTIGTLIYNLGNNQWDIPDLRKLLETVLPQQSSFDNYEVEHDFTTIGRRTMLLNARQIKREEGENRVILLAIEDITVRKQVEASQEQNRLELKVLKKVADEATEFIESIVNAVREPLIVLDQDLRVVTVSRSFYEFFKVEPSDTIGELIYNLGNNQWNILKLRELLETILPEQSSFDNYEVEHDFTTLGRRTMLLNARQIEREKGKNRVILLAIEDITERKQIEADQEQYKEELRGLKQVADEASEYIESIVNAVREPLIVLDQHLRVVTVSRSFYDFFKVESEDTIGKLIYNLGNNQWDILKLRELLETILPEQSSFDNYEVEHNFKTIGRRTMLLNARQIEREKGKKRVILLAIEDITERKQTETALEQHRDELETLARQLERADQVKSEFLASMSHELRTPLNAIIGFSEVLMDGIAGGLNEEQSRYAGNIFHSGEHLLSLINDVLDLSKVEAGKMSLNLEQLQPQVLLHDSLSMVKEKAMNHGIQLSEDITANLGRFVGDARKLKQMVYNLLSNAVKFTLSGGEITLSARRVPRAQVGVLAFNKLSQTRVVGAFDETLNRYDEFLSIAIIDTGIGISEIDLGKLFQPFTQIDTSLSRKYEGTGLGLMIVQDLARLHGGVTAVSSALGQGSCFTIWLPWRESGIDADIDTSTPISIPIIAEQLIDVSGDDENHLPMALVVESDDESAQLISLALKKEGLSVQRVNTAEKALSLLKFKVPVLITLNIQLPGIDGWEFMSRCKKIPDIDVVPIIIITVDVDLIKGWALGASLMIEKPVSLLQLRKSVASTLEVSFQDLRGLEVLIVDDDPFAVDLIATRLVDIGISPLRAYGGKEAIDIARARKPPLIILDLMMPMVSGFDVVKALKDDPETAVIVIIVMTAKIVTKEDRSSLNGNVFRLIEKFEFDGKRLKDEIQNALRGNPHGEQDGSNTHC